MDFSLTNQKTKTNTKTRTTDVESHTESDAERGEVNKKFDKDLDDAYNVDNDTIDEDWDDWHPNDL